MTHTTSQTMPAGTKGKMPLKSIVAAIVALATLGVATMKLIGKLYVPAAHAVEASANVPQLSNISANKNSETSRFTVAVADAETHKPIKSVIVSLVMRSGAPRDRTDGNGLVTFPIAREDLDGAKLSFISNCYDDNPQNLNIAQRPSIVVELSPKKDSGCNTTALTELVRTRVDTKAPVIPKEPSTKEASGVDNTAQPQATSEAVVPEAQSSTAVSAAILFQSNSTGSESSPGIRRQTRFQRAEAINNSESDRQDTIPASSSSLHLTSPKVFVDLDHGPAAVQKMLPYLEDCLRHFDAYAAEAADASIVLKCAGCMPEDNSFQIREIDRNTAVSWPYWVPKSRGDDGSWEVEPTEALNLCSDVLSRGGMRLPHRETVNAAGATSVAPLIQELSFWFSLSHTEARLLYEGVGSGEGIQRLLLGQVDLAGSDVPLDRKQLQQVKFKILQVPIALVAFVPIYHIAEVSERDILRFTPEVLASIGRGAITMWNDPAIEAINPAVKLPAEAITIVHRSDPSGTTYIVSQFLSYYSRDWRDVGLTISWPEGSKEGAGNAGVARIVAEVPGALGFVEYIYALKNNLKYGYVRNRAGRFIRPNVESLSAAVPPTATLSSDPTKLIEQILKSDNESAYPITSVTWLLVAARKSSDGRRQVVGQFLPWMLTSGQNFCEGLRYGRLPKDLVESELKEIRQLP